MTPSIAARLKALEDSIALCDMSGKWSEKSAWDRTRAEWDRELLAVRAEAEGIAKEMREIRALYGELVPFDPATGGFDVALRREGQRKAVCLMMNAILNGEWADRLASEGK